MRKAFLSVALVGAMALAVAGIAAAVHLPGGPSGGGVQPSVVAMDVANACDGGVKIEDPASGGYNLFFGTFTIHLDITVTNTASGPTFSFSSPDPGEVVTSMYVKGGPTANFYQYGAGVTSDTGLHSPINDNNGKYYGLSHLCIFADKK